MKWIDKLLGTNRSEPDDFSADQAIGWILGQRVAAANPTPQQLLHEGREERRRHRPAVAHEHFVAAAQAAHRSGEPRLFAAALVELAENALHFFPEQRDVFRIRQVWAERAIALFRELGDEVGVAQALRVLATVSPSDAGGKMLADSLAISQRMGDVQGEYSSFERLGNHFAVHGDAETAASYKRKALELARELGDAECTAGSLYSLAIGFDGSNDERRALLEEAQELYARLGRRVSQAHCLILCATLACDDAELERKRDYFERAVQIGREVGDLSLVGTCLDFLLDLCREQGDFDRLQALERERASLAREELPDAAFEDWESAFSAGRPQSALAAVRKWFAGGAESG